MGTVFGRDKTTVSCHPAFMKWRIFTNDVGPNQYSALTDVTAPDLQAALKKIPAGLEKGTKILCLPHKAMALWPDGKSGRVSDKALEFGAVIG